MLDIKKNQPDGKWHLAAKQPYRTRQLTVPANI